MNKKIITRRRDERRQGKTDWNRVRAQTDEDIAKAAASDPDAAPILDDEWFRHAEVRSSKVQISIRLDADVLEFFRKQETRYQSKINAVLRSYMDATRKAS